MFTSEKFTEGDIYSRKQLSDEFEITDANLKNGIFRPAGYESIWLFVTEQKSKDRTPFYDQLKGSVLDWDGQPQGLKDNLIIEHEERGLELLVFYRKHRKEFLDYSFKYEGRFCYKSHSGSHPTHFILEKEDTILKTVEKDIESFQIEESYPEEPYQEGKLISRLVNVHERNPKLRAAAVVAHGTRCQACNFSFSETYGDYGQGFIEIHHLYPVSKYVGEVEVDPSEDMAAICANCHRMIHRNPNKPLTLDELRQIIALNRK